MASAVAERRRRHAVRHRLWALGALEQAGIDVEMANRQLVLPSEGKPFRAGVWPIPLTDRQERHPTFQGPLLKGTNPAGNYAGKKKDKANSCRSAKAGDQPADGESAPPPRDDRYSLAKRVEEHLPGSRAWLLEDIQPYFGDHVPEIRVAQERQRAVMKSLGLRRLSWSTSSFSERTLGDTHWYLARKQLDYFARVPTPTHLQLLILFYHEQVWQRPMAARRHDRYLTLIRDAFEDAVQTLASLPMLKRVDTGVDLPEEIEYAFRHVRTNIEFLGLRCEGAPSDDEGALLSPALFITDFEAFDDADFCAGLGFAVPLEHRENPKRYTRFSEGPEPTPEEAQHAMWELLGRAEIGRDTHLVDLHVSRSSLARTWERFHRRE